MSKDTIYRQDFDKFLEDAEKEAVKNRKYVYASAFEGVIVRGVDDESKTDDTDRE